MCRDTSGTRAPLFRMAFVEAFRELDVARLRVDYDVWDRRDLRVAAIPIDYGFVEKRGARRHFSRRTTCFALSRSICTTREYIFYIYFCKFAVCVLGQLSTGFLIWRSVRGARGVCARPGTARLGARGCVRGLRGSTACTQPVSLHAASLPRVAWAAGERGPTRYA